MEVGVRKPLTIPALQVDPIDRLRSIVAVIRRPHEDGACGRTDICGLENYLAFGLMGVGRPGSWPHGFVRNSDRHSSARTQRHIGRGLLRDDLSKNFQVGEQTKD
jgi:hypothetical protein